MGHPSGRLGKPWVPSPRRRDDYMLASATMESYSAVTPFKETLNRLRRALSRRGFEIMRECDLACGSGRNGAGSRVRVEC